MDPESKVCLRKSLMKKELLKRKLRRISQIYQSWKLNSLFWRHHITIQTNWVLKIANDIKEKSQHPRVQGALLYMIMRQTHSHLTRELMKKLRENLRCHLHLGRHFSQVLLQSIWTFRVNLHRSLVVQRSNRRPHSPPKNMKPVVMAFPLLLKWSRAWSMTSIAFHRNPYSQVDH